MVAENTLELDPELKAELTKIDKNRLWHFVLSGGERGKLSTYSEELLQADDKQAKLLGNEISQMLRLANEVEVFLDTTETFSQRRIPTVVKVFTQFLFDTMHSGITASNFESSQTTFRNLTDKYGFYTFVENLSVLSGIVAAKMQIEDEKKILAETIYDMNETNLLEVRQLHDGIVARGKSKIKGSASTPKDQEELMQKEIEEMTTRIEEEEEQLRLLLEQHKEKLNYLKVKLHLVLEDVQELDTQEESKKVAHAIESIIHLLSV